MWDAGVDELFGYRTDIGCTAADAVDGCFGERDVWECGSSDSLWIVWRVVNSSGRE